MPACFAAALVLVVCAQPLAAQAPVITEAGDPSVASDSIYALAVDPADYPDDAIVYLLDDGVLRLESDGTGTRTYRYVVQVLTREAAESWAEQSFSYEATREQLRINWIRVLDGNGKLVSDEPLQDQEGLSPAARQSPVFTDHRTRRISLAGVRPGYIIDYSYTVESLEPFLPGDFHLSWAVTTGAYTRRSRLVIDVPVGYEPRLTETNLDFERHTTNAGTRRVYSWITGEIPKVDSQPFAGWPNDVYARITATGPLSWADVGRWYHDLSADRYTVSAAMLEQASDALRGARSRADTVRALHRWVAQDIRYVSLSLGIGGYQPREPAVVLESAAGDCKDKSTLLVALLRHFGIEAYPVLTSLGSLVDTEHPALAQFDHMIVAVRLHDGDDYVFADPTADLIEFGRLPTALDEEFGLLVRTDGSVETLVLPTSTAADNRSVERIVGAIDEAGRFAGAFTMTASGSQGDELRYSFRRPFTSIERDNFLRGVAGAIFPEAEGESYTAFDGLDLSITPEVAVHVRDGVALTGHGRSRVFQLPIPTFSYHPLVREIREKTPRRFPVSSTAVVGPVENTWELRVELPEGWIADLPPAVTADSRFGSYSAEYSQQGRELVVIRRLRGTRGVFPPESHLELIEWLQQISTDDARHLIIITPG